jgi:hypothetical protein
MKILQNTTSKLDVVSAVKAKAERLPSGESISKAIFMAGRMCCGSAYVEKAS